MAVRDQLLPLIYNVRAIPGSFGLRPFTVSIRTGQWNGTNTGRGAEGIDLVPITEANGQPPKVRQLNTEELALGNLGKGSIQIGPITPAFPGGGTSEGAFGDLLEQGMTLHLVVTGPGTSEYGDLYLLKDVKTDRALHYTLTAEPVATVGNG